MEHVQELVLDSREELKRLEHIIYVTLKYTRTVDVLVNALTRLVAIYDLLIEAYLEKAKIEQKVESLPKSPALRAKQLGGLYPADEVIQKNLIFYNFLKIMLNRPHFRREEFRRHVTLLVEFENSTGEVAIDHLVNCERFVHLFFKHSLKQILGKGEEEN